MLSMRAKKNECPHAFFLRKIWCIEKKVITLHSVSGMNVSSES